MPKFFKTFLFILVVAGAVAYFGAKVFTAFNADQPKENVSGPSITYISSSNPSTSNIAAQTQTASAPQKIVSSYKKSVSSARKNSAPQDNSGYAIPSGYTRAQISPFFQKVRISSVYPSLFSSYPSEIQLYSYFTEKSQRIDITGWKLKSNKKEITIDKAVDLYELLGFSAESDIILNPNSYVSVYSNTSAVNKNLRLNKCSGYLENNYPFVPALPRNCPLITRPIMANLSGQCQSYIDSLNTCQIPSVSVYNSFPGGDDGNSCRAFLEDLNYTSCVKEHRNDQDFYLNDWRVWANQTILDSQHDTVKLFDGAGLLVDQYIY